MKLVPVSFLALLLLVVCGCQESMEERVAREVREHTLKSCPLEIAPGLTNDSVTFDRASRTVRYHFTMRGAMDGLRVDTVAARERLERVVDNATNLRKYKSAAFVFRYTYYSERSGLPVLDFIIPESSSER